MATLDDVARIVMAMPETTQNHGAEGEVGWRVRDKLLAWERPLRPKEISELGRLAPKGVILCARTPDLGAKEALLADPSGTFFTTKHFNGYPMVLIQLAKISLPELKEILLDAWVSRVPKKVAKAYLESNS
jgi:hypothetical protein